MKRVTIVSLFLMGVMLNAVAQTPDLLLKNVKFNDITFDDIQYWVGSGTNRCLLIVNWCEPEIAFAWGYRYESDSISVSKVLEDIADADARFAYVDGGGFITEITYHDSNYSLALKGGYWMYNINEGAVSGIADQYVHKDDYIEFGDEFCGVSDSAWVYVWPIPVTPVSNPSGDTTHIAPININVYEYLVYPNPANEQITCELKGWNESVTVSIHDMKGRLMYSDKMECKESTTVSVSLANFSKGMYFLHLQSDNRLHIQKLIIY